MSRFTHPDGNHEIVAVAGTQLLGEITKYEVTKYPDAANWVTIGYIGAEKIMVEESEWAAFKALVAEIDEALK